MTEQRKPRKNLFPEFDDAPTVRARRQYVARRLVELAEAGELFVTDIFAHGPAVSTLAGEVILGQDHDQSGAMVAAKVPRSLLNYTVRVRSIPWMKQFDTENEDGSTSSRFREVKDEPIAFQVAAEEEEDDGMTYESARDSGMRAWGDMQVRYRKVWVHTGKTLVDLDLDQAWWCLRQYGKYVKHASSRRAQRNLWRCEEVHPSEYQDAPKKRGPGRPRKEAQEVAGA